MVPRTGVQCMVGVVPLGTGNDLARVLGWGAQCGDEDRLPQLLSEMELSTFKLLDRWSVQFSRSTDVDTSPLVARSTAVSVGWSVGVCVCMCACMYVLCVCMCVYVCMYVCMYVYVYACVYVCVCMYVCMYVYMCCVCMYVLVCTCIVYVWLYQACE